MTKEEIIELIGLLSALESWSYEQENLFPDYLYEKIEAANEVLKREVLK